MKEDKAKSVTCGWVGSGVGACGVSYGHYCACVCAIFTHYLWDITIVRARNGACTGTL